MKKVLLIFCLLCLSTPLYGATHRLGLIIGNNVGNNGLTNLRYAEQDARNLYQTLTQIGGFPPGQMRLLLGKNPETLAVAIKSLQAQALHFLKNSSDQVLLLIYFSGHSENGSLEFGPENLDYKDFLKQIRTIPSTLRIFVIDACRSGEIIRSKGGTVIPPFKVVHDGEGMPRGEIIITSSTGIEESLESDDLQGSFFTHFLISGLRGEADFNLDGKVSLSEVYSFASEKTTSRSAKYLRGQHPTFEFDLTGAGEIYLTKISESAPLVSLAPSEQGTFLIYNKQNRELIVEVEKKPGTPQFIAVPEGNIIIQKKGTSYSLEEEIVARMGGLYEFHEESGRKVKMNPGRRILTYLGDPSHGKAVFLREGEPLKLRLLETVNSQTSHMGDKVRLESAEDIYVDGKLAIAAGAPSHGEILAIRKKSGIIHGELVLRIGFVQATDGQWIPLESIVSRSNTGLRTIDEGENPLTEIGSKTESRIASGVTAFFFLPFYPFIRGRAATIEVGTLFDAYVARSVKIQ